MSFIKDNRVLKKTTVKAGIREDIDINKLVANAATQIIQPQSQFVDLTDFPTSLGEAEIALLSAYKTLRRLKSPVTVNLSLDQFRILTVPQLNEMLAAIPKEPILKAPSKTPAAAPSAPQSPPVNAPPTAPAAAPAALPVTVPAVVPPPPVTPA